MTRTDSARAAPPPGWKEWAGVVAICVAALALLLSQLGGFSMGNDEAAYARRAAQSWHEVWIWLVPDNIPPLYPILVKLWCDVAGIEPFAIRLPGALLAAGFLPLYFTWLRKRLPPELAWTAFVLLSFSPFFLGLGRIAKYFSLFSFLVCVAVALTWSIVEEKKEVPLRLLKGRIVLWGLAMLAAIWIQYIAFAVWGSIGAWLLWRWWRGDARSLRVFGLQSAFFAGFLPWMPVLLGRVAGIAESEPAVYTESPLRRLVGQAGYTVYAYAVGQTIEPGHLILAGLAVTSFSVLMLTGLVRVLGRWGTPLPRFLLFHGLLMGIVSFVILRVFVPEHPILSYAERLGFMLPMLIVLPASALAGARAAVRWIALAAYVPGAAFSLWMMATNGENVQWEYTIPWDRIRAEVLRGGAEPVVVMDNWHMGSRGWYYFRDLPGDRFIEAWTLQREGRLESEAARLVASGQEVCYVRSVRDNSIGGWVTDFGEMLGAGMEETDAGCFAVDSPAMMRMKELFRRGSSARTFPCKLEVLRFTPQQ